MQDAREEFVAGWRDAHAMERQSRTVMQIMSGRLDDYPQFPRRLAEHAQETEVQIERLNLCLDLLGTSPSMLEDTGMRMLGLARTLLNAATSSEVIKDMLGAVARENFEVASHRSLIAFARVLGEERLVPQLTESLREEEAMARWMGDHVEALTKEFSRIASIPGQLS